jgi:hypothetical protein
MTIRNGVVFGLKVAAVGVVYIAATMAAGVALGAAGMRLPATGDASASLLQAVVMGLGFGLCLGPLAARLRVPRRWHLVIWGSVMFFNFAAVILEGGIFTSALGQALPALIVMTLISTLATAGALTALFAKRPAGAAAPVSWPRRTAMGWAGRFALSALSYVIFYWVFGALNYRLVTHVYFETHQAALLVPPTQTIVLVELVRAVMLVLSVLPLALAWPITGANRWRLAVLCGLVLFLIGGAVPLAGNSILPLFLRVATGWEIFLQNFSTGVVAALLLGTGGEGGWITKTRRVMKGAKHEGAAL